MLTSLLVQTLLIASVVNAQDDDQTLQRAFAVHRPWVAEKLQLTATQKKKVASLIERYQTELRKSMRGYPTGAQDSEGLAIRRQILNKVADQRKKTAEELQQLLSAKQLAALSKLKVTDLSPPELGRVEYFDFHLGTPPRGLPAMNLDEAQMQALAAIHARTSDTLRGLLANPPAQPKVFSQQLSEIRTTSFDQVLRVLNEQQKAQMNRYLHELKPGPKFYLLSRFTDERMIAPFRKKTTDDGRSLIVRGSWAELTKSGSVYGKRLWHDESERLIAEYTFSPGGRWVVTAANRLPKVEQPNDAKEEGELCVWDARTGDRVGRFVLSGSLDSLAFVGEDLLIVHSLPINGR